MSAEQLQAETGAVFYLVLSNAANTVKESLIPEASVPAGSTVHSTFVINRSTVDAVVSVTRVWVLIK